MIIFFGLILIGAFVMALLSYLNTKDEGDNSGGDGIQVGNSTIVPDEEGGLRIEVEGETIVNINESGMTVNSGVESVDTGTGALVVDGGVGLSGNINIGGTTTSNDTLRVF